MHIICTNKHKHSEHTETFPHFYLYVQIQIHNIPTNVSAWSTTWSLLHCSWCWAPSLLCAVSPPPLGPPPTPTTSFSFSQYIWHAQLLRSAIIIPPETHTPARAHTRLPALFDGSSGALVFGDPRRSLLLSVTTGASLECVHRVYTCVLCVPMRGAFGRHPDVFFSLQLRSQACPRCDCPALCFKLFYLSYI